ncbi:hypothetical protein YC2023_075360 [Brassica napus]
MYEKFLINHLIILYLIRPSFLSFSSDDTFSPLGSYLHSSARYFVKSEPDNQKSYHNTLFLQTRSCSLHSGGQRIVSRFSEAFTRRRKQQCYVAPSCCSFTIWECDVTIHTVNLHVSAHHRFLLNGTRVSFESTGTSPSGKFSPPSNDDKLPTDLHMSLKKMDFINYHHQFKLEWKQCKFLTILMKICSN